jgi:hypothetical protein
MGRRYVPEAGRVKEPGGSGGSPASAILAAGTYSAARGPMPHPPHSEELAAASIEAASEVDRLKARQRPRKSFDVARSMDERGDAAAVLRVLKGVEELTFHPLRTNRLR